MDVAIVGAGAMGCLYGGFLARAGENRVILLDRRPERVAAIKARGVVIKTPQEVWRIPEASAASAATGLGPQELVMICVKAFDAEAALADVLELVGPKTMVLTLQNGLGNWEKLAGVVEPGRVLGGVTNCGATVAGLGEIDLRGLGETVLGEPPLKGRDGPLTPRLRRLQRTFERAGFPTALTTNLTGRLWTKLIVNAAVNALCSLLDCPNGKLLESPNAEALLKLAAAEAAAVAEAAGVALSTDDPLDHVKAVVRNTAENVCSMVQDLRTGRRTEVEFINGAVVAEGHRRGVPTPVNLALTNLVKALERLGRRADLEFPTNCLIYL
jgi:2-dehydropantoate 2-reductase